MNKKILFELLIITLLFSGCAANRIDRADNPASITDNGISADKEMPDKIIQEPGLTPELNINKYLAEKLGWVTMKNGVVFCSHEILEEEFDQALYIQAMCEEFISGDERLETKSGFSGPVKLSVRDGEIKAHKQPRDGSLYLKDIEEIFPKGIQGIIMNYRPVKLEKNNRFEAREYFGYEDKYKMVETGSEACAKHADCETPMDYLIRSSCPFESRCLDNKCTVVCPSPFDAPSADASGTEPILRGDEDEFGCIGSAGYSWCEAKEECLRTWEEPCENTGGINNFDDCVKAGNPVMESYPRQCRAGERIFTENIGDELDKADKLILDSPRPNELIKSPLEIKGKAVGTWFFEASFPVVLTNWDGLIIAQGIATAEGDWMTEDFVPFSATLEFTADTGVSDRGALILQKDNPSGLPEHDDAFEIPVRFGA